MANKNLNKAKKAKNDEFYTQLSDIENEMKHYREHFKDKVVYMNCDDPQESNFWKYFALNFDFFEIKKLVSTHYDEEEPTYKMTLDRDEVGKMNDYGRDEVGVPMGRIEPLKQNGDFRSDESIELLKEADVVVTNPPFSLFREYIAQLIEYDKKFVVMGNQNAITYKEIFPLLKDGTMWLGNNGGNMYFQVPDEGYGHRASNLKFDDEGNKYISVQGIRWYTNLEYPKRFEDQILYRTYEGNEEEYPKYDNYDAIEVSRVKNIPMDYEGVMGVPITFMNNHNPEQFEVLGMIKGSDAFGAERKKIYVNPTRHSSNKSPVRDNNVNAAPAIKLMNNTNLKKYYTADNSDGFLISLYARILIRNLKPETPEWK